MLLNYYLDKAYCNSIVHLYYKTKTKEMKVTNNILTKLLTEREFRLNVALDSGLSEQAILRAAERNSESLTKLKTLNAIVKHSGLTQDEVVCEPETA